MMNSQNYISDMEVHSNLKMEIFKVSGNCEMCEERIETAAKELDGTIKADWNKDSKEIEVMYNPQNLTLEDIHKKIAATGHDTDHLKASYEMYNNLHGCCEYRE